MPQVSGSVAALVPHGNCFDFRRLRGAGAARALEDVYGIGRARRGDDFHGAFSTRDDSEQESWARRFARYSRDEFHANNDGPTRLSDIQSTLTRASLDGEWLTYRHALELWKANAPGEVEPYTIQQDYGSCVDASFAEMVTALLGFRAAHPELFPNSPRERYSLSVAWYLYAERGYCSDGWDGFSIASVAKKFGIAFRKNYSSGSQTANFRDDDTNEQIVARSWCRSGIPDWMAQESRQSHSFDPTAIVEFDGDVQAMADVLAAGGALHFGGTKTSGGSRPFTVGNVGGHEQATVGGIGSERYRKFCKDTIGVTLSDQDFAIINNQTWGAGFSGECADRYWPDYLGPKPQGAWVWKATDLLRYFEGDILAYLPRVTGILDPTPGPTPPGPTPPGPTPPGPTPSGITVAGEISLNGRAYILVPKPVL